MNPEYILWGIPAYLAFLVFQLAKPVRNRSGWDFVASIAIFALVIHVLSTFLLKAIEWSLPSDWDYAVFSFWNRFFPAENSEKLAIGLFICVPVGLVLGTLWVKLHSRLTDFVEWWTGRRKSYHFSDLFFATCDQLLGKLILLTLNNSKVYVGVLLQATDDPNENARFIKIMPIMSGYRSKEEGKVTFDTDYVGTQENADQLPNRDLLISMSNVVTLAKFDEELHNWFVATGRTAIESARAVSGSSETSEISAKK